MAVIRTVQALIAASLIVLALAACLGPAAAPPTSPAPPGPSPETAAPAPTPSPTVPQPARQSAALEDQRALAAPPPTRLEIPDLGIDVTVQPVGLDDRGQMGLFDDTAIAAWYQWGPAPASAAGSTVIAAHVDSLEYDLLPFARLRDAVGGMQVIVTDAAGGRHGYAVQAVEVSEKSAVDWSAAFDRTGSPRLTLVTCGGEFDVQNRRYLSNLVLTAVRVG
ncbi:class F sortase [Agromyces silvae]|uniref:class F sortase n=1 Tax=Agromyces silvae TaxID=3388266 RepID=UPI00280BE2C0|nr:class F sortase [Agromyces protaetiae]